MPIQHSAVNEFFTEYKERSFLNPDVDEPGHDLGILAMLLNLLTRASRNREMPQHRAVVTYTIIEIGQSNSNSTVLLVENRISHRHHNDLNAERSSYGPPIHLSAPEYNEEVLNNLVF